MRPTYADNVRPLMDSRDYVVLLQGSEGAHIPWQQVDNDNNNVVTHFTEVSDFIFTTTGCWILRSLWLLISADVYLCFQWVQSRLQPCSGTVTVCGFDQGAQENWLITQHISRELAGGQRLRKVFSLISHLMDVILVDSVDNHLMYTNGRHPPLTEMWLETLVIMTKLIVFRLK